LPEGFSCIISIDLIIPIISHTISYYSNIISLSIIKINIYYFHYLHLLSTSIIHIDYLCSMIQVLYIYIYMYPYIFIYVYLHIIVSIDYMYEYPYIDILWHIIHSINTVWIDQNCRHQAARPLEESPSESLGRGA
jgi:hypothetical protein